MIPVRKIQTDYYMSNVIAHCRYGTDFSHSLLKFRMTAYVSTSFDSDARSNILRFNHVHHVTAGRHRIAFRGIDAVLGMRLMH
jgi:hypothetical protein